MEENVKTLEDKYYDVASIRFPNGALDELTEEQAHRLIWAIPVKPYANTEHSALVREVVDTILANGRVVILEVKTRTNKHPETIFMIGRNSDLNYLN